MKLCLATNILEHDAFFRFVEAVRGEHPDVAFVVAGDLLNVFPEPGEDLRGSIFQDLYGGALIADGLDELVRTRFRDVARSRLVDPLRQMFSGTGERYADATRCAARRYGRFFDRLDAARGASPFIFVPGNMDYPRLCYAETRHREGITQIDADFIELSGVRVGGVGGIPNTNHPFRGVVEISPYEMTEAEYARRLRQTRDVDVLVTHLSPEEYPPLDAFLADSPVRLLVCRAPFNFRREGDYRGRLETEVRYGKQVIKVRPFDHPANTAYLLDLDQGLRPEAIQTLRWTDSAEPLPTDARAPLRHRACAPV